MEERIRNCNTTFVSVQLKDREVNPLSIKEYSTEVG